MQKRTSRYLRDEQSPQQFYVCVEKFGFSKSNKQTKIFSIGTIKSIKFIRPPNKCSMLATTKKEKYVFAMTVAIISKKETSIRTQRSEIIN